MITQTIGSLGTLPDATTMTDDQYAAACSAVMVALAARLTEMSTVISQWNADHGAPATVAFSATPTFDASKLTHYLGALSGNVTSFTISNATDGTTIRIRFIQDATGGRSVALPSNVKASGSIDTTASRASILTLIYVGTTTEGAVNRWEGFWTQVGA